MLLKVNIILITGKIRDCLHSLSGIQPITEPYLYPGTTMNKNRYRLLFLSHICHYYKRIHDTYIIYIYINVINTYSFHIYL